MYEEYPMVMTHPNAQPAVFVAEGQNHQSRPATLTPVTVEDEDQRLQYEAKGYLPAGKGDPSAYAQAACSAPPEHRAFQEYPKWVGDVLVNSREEEDALGKTLEIATPNARTDALPVDKIPDLSRHKPNRAA